MTGDIKRCFFVDHELRVFMTKILYVFYLPVIRVSVVLAVLFCVPSVLYAASVKGKIKKRSVVVIDAGKTADISTGDSICFYDANQEEVGCGTVRRVQEERSFVRVGSKVLREVRTGFTASPAGGSSAGGGSSKGSSKYVSIRLLSGGVGLQAYNANFPGYSKSVAPYWEKHKDHKLLGFGASANAGIEIEVVPIYTSIGYRFNFINPSFDNGETNYTAHSTRSQEECGVKQGQTKNPCYISIDFESQSMGGWLQFLYPFSLSPDFVWGIGLGVDVDYSVLKFSIQQRTDNKPDLAHDLLKDVESSLVSIGVRVIPAHISFALSENLDVFLTAISVFGIVPAYQDITDYKTQDRNVEKSANSTRDKEKFVSTYFKDALDHRPGIGLMFHGGLGISF